VGNFLISGGVGGARNLGEGGGEDDVGMVDVGEGGVRVAVDCDCGGTSDAGNVGIVEGNKALTGRGEFAIISGNGGMGGA
jgi:hypothetical protein